MSLLFIDGFEDYDEATAFQAWDAIDEDTFIDIISGGRNGRGLQIAGPTMMRKIVPSTTSFVIGGAFKFTNTNENNIMEFRTTTDGYQCTLQVTSSPHLLRFRRGSGSGTILATGATTLSNDVWYYIELKVTIGNSGSFEVKLNGTTEISGSGVDTQEQATNTAEQIGVGANQGVLDDIYMFDSSGSVNNDFAGDSVIGSIFPRRDAEIQFTGSDGNAIDNYEMINENIPNELTTYVYEANASEKDLYYMQQIPYASDVNIKGIYTFTRARKNEAGTKTLKPQMKQGATIYEFPEYFLSNSFDFIFNVLETDFVTSSPWTVAGINNTLFGFKVQQ